MPGEIFDTLLPVGLAIAAFFLFGGLFAMGKRKTQMMGHLLLLFSGLALLFTGVDYMTATSDIGLSVLVIGAGVAVFFFAIWEAF